MNDITPPKKTLSEAVAQADASPAATSHVMPKKHRWPKVLLGVMALLVVAGAYIGWQTWNNRNYPPKGTYAIVGTQSESQKNFDEIKSAYIKFDQASAAGKNVDAAKTERRAADEVILRLALQDEAKKLGKQYCDQTKVDELLKDNYSSEGGRSAYYSKLKSQYGWTEQVSAHQQCLEYYKELLQDDLIAGHELFGVYVRWDVALGQDKALQDSVENKAVAKLTKQFLPLFEQKADDATIEQQADINGNTTTEDFDAKTIDLGNPPSRVLKLARFNSEIYKTFQQYSEGEDETQYVNNLEQGEYTKIFKSKTGYYVIYRATKKFNGSYGTYDELLAKALEAAKVDRSYAKLPEPDKVEKKPQETGQGLSFVSGVLSRALRLFVPAAHAATPNSITCYGDSHKLPFSVEYRDAATKSIIQSNSGQIKITSTGDIKTPCKDEPAAGTNAYGVNVSYGGINSGQITYDAPFHPNPWNFGLTCYTSWRFNFGAPSGYEELSSADYANKSLFYLKVEYASSSYAGYTASSTSGQYQIPQQYYTGIANGAKGFTIRVYFTKKPPLEGPKGQIWSLSKIKDGAGYSADWKVPPDVTLEEKKRFYCLKGQKDFTPSVDYSVRCSADIVNGVPNASKLWGGQELKDKLDVGVYSAGVNGGVTDWSLKKIEVTYPDQCGSHAKGVETFSSVGAVNVRVCEGQTPTVVFYFDPPPSEVKYGPWLQTRKGNVLALGRILGQRSTLAGAGINSADYVVMAYLTQDNSYVSTNFCSIPKYNLGLSGPDSPTCSYSNGYRFNSTADFTNDPVITGVEKIFAGGAYDGPCSASKPYKVSLDLKTVFQGTQSSANGGFGATADCPIIGKPTRITLMPLISSIRTEQHFM